jgi:hypothetical protein
MIRQLERAGAYAEVRGIPDESGAIRVVAART